MWRYNEIRGANTGERKRIENAEYVEEQKKLHVLKECKITRNEIPIEEFIGEERKGLELMNRKSKRKDEERRINEEEGEELE